jgi:mannosyl-glycoprotein endo-beta-N-acetylglucosaminidase
VARLHRPILPVPGTSSSVDYTFTGINIVCTLKFTSQINLVNTDKNTKFPPVESWITEGDYISWL